MKKSILNIGKALNKLEQKTIQGGQFFGGPCYEWCADPSIQEIFWKPLGCRCNSNGSSGSSNGSSGNNNGNPYNGGGPVDPV